MNRSVPVGAVRLFGDAALLIGVDDAAAGRALARELSPVCEDCDIVGGLRTVMVSFDPTTADVESLRRVVDGVRRADGRRRAPMRGTSEAGATVTVACVFDGPDLGEVAERAGRSASEVVALLTSQPLPVEEVGFSPGFAYLGGLPGPLRDIPRRDQPRPSVPPGSVALANGHAAIYPTASPGGWHLIGRTGDPMFSLSAPPYARLAPGDRVRLTVPPAGEVGEPAPLLAPPWSMPATARPVFEVAQPGLRTVLQDGGRRGVAAIGVPGAGPADPVSLVLANRLVGNPDRAAALEITASGPTLRGVASGYVAVVGGSPDIHLQGRSAAAGQVLPIGAGQVVEIGRVRRGLRSYVAVAGGFVGPELFGSVASDQLCGLGPGPLSAGDRLFAGTWTPPLGDHLGATPAGADEGDTIVLRVVPGPHPEWFAPDALAVLAAAEYTVEDLSNRVGLRLRPRADDGELRPSDGAWSGLSSQGLDSQGMVVGAVQVPPSGHPIVLMPDHATLGGYPVVAVVVSADHGRLGQCAPGAPVRLVVIDQAQAREALRLRQRVMETAVTGHYPLVVE